MRMFKKKRKGNIHLYSRWAYKRGDLYPGELIYGIKYSLANGWAYIRGGGLKSGILRYVTFGTETEEK